MRRRESFLIRRKSNHIAAAEKDTEKRNRTDRKREKETSEAKFPVLLPALVLNLI